MSHDLKITAYGKNNKKEEVKQNFAIEGGSKLEVFDEDGKLLHEGEFKSFTSNFLKLLYGSMIGAGTTKAKDLSNTDIEMNAFPQSTFNIAGGAGIRKFGVVVGTNSTAVSVSDYNITVPASLTVNDTVVSASSIGADSISVEISRQISNSSGVLVSLTEAGLICGSEDEVDSNVLIARDRLNVMLADGQKSTWRYTINFNFANDKGGFVKTLANQMFNGVFKEATSSASWSGRALYASCVFDNKMWVMGGTDGSNFYNDVWESSDGVTWIQATSSAAWSRRSRFSCVVFDNKMWVMGGYDGSNFNDVWESSDGVTWIQVTSSAGWSGRRLYASCVFDNKMWVMGGYDVSYLNDVWESSDGATWIQVTSSAGWSGRALYASCVFDNKMWVIGGYDGSNFNDVWESSDGATWIQVTSSAGWSGRRLYASCVFDNKMWVMGGADGSNFYNDVWESSDGVTWIQATSSADWSVRSGFNCVVFDNKIWIMGGSYSSSYLHDVWSFKNLISEIKPGSSDSAFSATATALSALIANGSGSGELIYGIMPSAGTMEPSVSGNKTKFSIAREFTNNSGADITVREVGLFSGSDMLARLIFAQPVVIPNGESEVISVDFETEV